MHQYNQLNASCQLQYLARPALLQQHSTVIFFKFSSKMPQVAPIIITEDLYICAYKCTTIYFMHNKMHHKNSEYYIPILCVLVGLL